MTDEQWERFCYLSGKESLTNDEYAEYVYLFNLPVHPDD